MKLKIIALVHCTRVLSRPVNSPAVKTAEKHLSFSSVRGVILGALGVVCFAMAAKGCEGGVDDQCLFWQNFVGQLGLAVYFSQNSFSKINGFNRFVNIHNRKINPLDVSPRTIPAADELTNDDGR